MAQVIYTGQNAGTPLQGNQSLQAATQFAQNDMTRKRDELSTSLKERDTFLSNLKYDPIFVASTKANEKMAENLDKYTSKWSEINNKRKGKLSTKDFAEMQLDRSVMMAEADMYKEGNDRGARQLQEFQNNKGQYDPVEFEAAYKEWMDTGMVPKTGLLYPAYKDPAVVWQKDKSIEPTVEKKNTTSPDGILIVTDVSYFKNPDGSDITNEQREQYAVNTYDVDPNIQYQYNLKYRDSSPELKKIADDYAMEKGYESGAKALAAIEGIKYLWSTPKKDTAVRGGGKGKGLLVVNNGGISFSDGDKTYFNSGDNLKTTYAGSGTGVAYVQRDIKPFEVPIDMVDLHGMEKPVGVNTITVMPVQSVFGTGLTELAPVNTEGFYTEGSVEQDIKSAPPKEYLDAPENMRSKRFDVNTKKQTYTWKTPKKGVSITINTEAAKDLFNSNIHPDFWQMYNDTKKRLGGAIPKETKPKGELD